jgi:hypothetical protein
MAANIDPRPSLVLRVMQFAITRLVLLGGGLFLLMGISNGFSLNRFAESPWRALASAAAMAALGLAAYAGFVRFVERRTVNEIPWPGAGLGLAGGVLLGLGLCTVCVLILIGFGVYRINGLHPALVLLPALSMALSSLSNPEGTLQGALFITVEAGLLLAAAFMLTRRLWLAMGLHMSWNFALAGVFSGAVSGTGPQRGLIDASSRRSSPLSSAPRPVSCCLRWPFDKAGPCRRGGASDLDGCSPRAAQGRLPGDDLRCSGRRARAHALCAEDAGLAHAERTLTGYAATPEGLLSRL